MMGGRCATCLVPVLCSIFICKLVTCESSIQRTDYKTGEVTVCRRINCTAGSYVKVCRKNGTDDRCERCPSGTHLLDNTSSDLPTPCVTGTAIIPPPEPLSSLVTTWGPTVSSTPQRTGPGRGTVTMVTLTNDSPTETSDSPTDTSDSQIDNTSDSGSTTKIAIYVAIVAGVLLVILVVAVVVLVVKCYRKRRSRPNNGTDMNEMELQLERIPLRDTSNMASNETVNEIGRREHYSNGMTQCHSETEITGEATQNGHVNTPPPEIPSQEMSNGTMYKEESEPKELYTEHNHQTYGGERIIDPSPFTSSEQMSNNAAAVGSTVDLQSASPLDPDSITKEDNYPDSIKLDTAPPLDIKQLHGNN